MPDPYDVLTVAAVTDELSATIANGRIQRIGLLDPRTIGAEIYAGGQRHHLIASADDRGPRLRLAPEMPSLDTALVTPFGLLLRKHARGGLILGIDQPPLERLVRFSIAKRLDPLTTGERGIAPEAAPVEGTEDTEDTEDTDVDGPQDDEALRHSTLYVELMGRHSNLILVDAEGRIMESAKRVTSAMSRVRQILPRLPYQPPPPPDRLDPRYFTPAEVERFLMTAASEADLARVIVTAFRGISPLMAREIAFQVTGAHDARVGDLGPDAPRALASAIPAVLAPLQTTTWSPRVYRERSDAGPGEIVAFSPLPMAHLAAQYAEFPVESVSAGLALAEHGGEHRNEQRHLQRRQRLLDAVSAAREKAERRLAALAAEAIRARDVERFRRHGEHIYANLWQIAPGQRELVAEDETIPLDPTLSASENAQAYFERYRKAQSAERQLPGLAGESRADIAYLDQFATLVAHAPGFSELEALAAEWADLDAPETDQRCKRKSAPRQPRALVDAAGNRVFVGRSGPQNDLVTFDLAGTDDTWLHARGVGGSHVIVRWQTPGGEENPETIEAAAALAAWYSSARDSGRVEVDVARRRHVRKLKSARPGMVTYRNERTIRVKPAPEDQLRDVLTDR